MEPAQAAESAEDRTDRQSGAIRFPLTIQRIGLGGYCVDARPQPPAPCAPCACSLTSRNGTNVLGHFVVRIT